MTQADDFRQPQTNNEALTNYLRMTAARWPTDEWWDGIITRTQRRERQTLIDNEGLDLEEGNDFA